MEQLPPAKKMTGAPKGTKLFVSDRLTECAPRISFPVSVEAQVGLRKLVLITLRRLKKGRDISNRPAHGNYIPATTYRRDKLQPHHIVQARRGTKTSRVETC